MHELSIAKALIQLADRYRPPGRHVRSLCVQAGPLQAIDESAMRWAWQAATVATDYDGAALQLEFLPWRLRCRDCGRSYECQSWEVDCRCGSGRGIPEGGDELLLTSLEVDEHDSLRRSIAAR